MDREASSLQYKATFCPEPARSSCSVFTLPSSQTKRGPRLEPAGEPQALPLRLWRPSPPPSPSGPGGAPLHSGSHLFPLHRRAAHQAMSKSRSWYHFRDGTHRAPRTHPAARVLIQRREDMAGRQAGSTAQKLCQWRLWVPSPAGWSQVSPFLPRSVTPGSHGWEKLCSQGLWPRGTKGLTQPCWGRKVCLGLVQPCPGHDRVVFPHHSRDSQRVHSKPPPNLRVPPECPLPQALQPHLAQVPALAVLHGQQGQVVGSQALHAFRDVPGGHHIGVVQPRGEAERVRGADTRLTPAPQSLEVPGPGGCRGEGRAALGLRREPWSCEGPGSLVLLRGHGTPPALPNCSKAEKTEGLRTARHCVGTGCVWGVSVCGVLVCSWCVCGWHVCVVCVVVCGGCCLYVECGWFVACVYVCMACVCGVSVFARVVCLWCVCACACGVCVGYLCVVCVSVCGVWVVCLWRVCVYSVCVVCLCLLVWGVCGVSVCGLCVCMWSVGGVSVSACVVCVRVGCVWGVCVWSVCLYVECGWCVCACGMCVMCLGCGVCV